MIFSRKSLKRESRLDKTNIKRKRPRTCVGCRQENPKRGMLRIVRDPDGNVSIDPTGKKTGRGAYLCLNAECLMLSRKKKALSKALNVNITDTLYEEIAEYIKQVTVNRRIVKMLPTNLDNILSLLGIARRAGFILIGLDVVKSSLVSGDKLLILVSEDPSSQVRKTLDAFCRRGQALVFEVEDLSRERLGNAIGLGPVQLVAIPEGHVFSVKLLQILSQGGDAIE